MEQVQLSEDEILDNFCHMVLEEYLIKREMRNTLKTFREEWNRPKEVRPLTIKNIDLVHISSLGYSHIFLV